MKKTIHPKYYPEAKVTCACGQEFTTGSTLPELQVEICSACHPFFTGQERFVDTEGRVEKFEKRRTEAHDVVQARMEKEKRAKKRLDKKEKAARERPKTLKEMLAKLDNVSK